MKRSTFVRTCAGTVLVAAAVSSAVVLSDGNSMRDDRDASTHLGHGAARQASDGQPELDLERPESLAARDEVEARNADAALDRTKATPAEPEQPYADPRLDFMTEAEADAYELLHRDDSIEDLREILDSIFARVPPAYVNSAHFEAMARGECEVLDSATKSQQERGNFSLDHRELRRNVPFISVVIKDAEQRVVRSTLTPDDFPAYREEVVHAIWIHFEKSERRAAYFRERDR